MSQRTKTKVFSFLVKMTTVVMVAGMVTRIVPIGR